MRILIIEDDPAIHHILGDLLSEDAHVTLHASDGRAGVRLARTEQPDLILLDLRLPEPSGDEVVQQLQAQPTTAAIPIIAMSAEPQLLTQLGAPPVSALLAKPFDLDRLVALIQQHEPGHAPGAAASAG